MKAGPPLNLTLRELISAAGADATEKAECERSERLLRYLESANKAHPLEIGKVQQRASWSILERWASNNDIADLKRRGIGTSIMRR